MKIVKCFLSLALALTIASGALAGDGDKKKADGKGKQAAGEKGDKAKRGEAAQKRREDAAKKRAEAGQKRRQPQGPSAMLLRGLELTEEQKKAIAPIDKDFGSKFAELSKARRELYTEEQRKAVGELLKKARESKERPGPELRKQIAEINKLSPEQKKKSDDLRAAFGKLRTDFLAKVDVILTDAQKKKLKSRGGARRGERKPKDGQKPAGERRKPDGAKKPEKKKDA